MVVSETLRENYGEDIVGSVPVYLDIEGMPPEVSRRMVEYYHEKLDNPDDNIHFNNMHRLAFYKTIEHTLFALFLYDTDNEKFLVNAGVYSDHVSALLKNFMHHLSDSGKPAIFEVYVEENLFEFEIRLNVINSRKYVFGILSTDGRRQLDEVNYIENIFYRYYTGKNYPLRGLFDYESISEINKNLTLMKRYAKENNRSMHCILIEIEPLKKYIRVAGDYLVNEIIRNVKMEIHGIIGGMDHCYILNSRQYLIAVTGMDEVSIKEKFKHAHFRIKNVLLVYRMKFLEITDPDSECDVYDFWSGLII